MTKRLVTCIQHPDELQEALAEARQGVGEGKQTDYAKGMSEGLRLAMRLVESHTFSRWVDS